VAHEQRGHHHARVERVAQDEVEVERGLVVARAAHGLHVEGEHTALDPRHLVVLDQQDAALAVRVGDEVALVLEVLEAGGALLDGLKAVVQDDTFQNEGLLTGFRSLLEPLRISGIPKLRVNVDAVALVVRPHAIRGGSIGSTRHTELDGVVVVAVEGLLQVPYHSIGGHLVGF